MPLPSGTTSVDTLQVLPGVEAFVSGQMLLEEYVPSPEDIFMADGASRTGTEVGEPWTPRW